MKKIFAVVGIILVVILCFVEIQVVEIQREQIQILQKEVTWIQKDIRLFRSQTLEDLTCLAANGVIGHNGYGEKRCSIDKRNINIFDWVGIEKMQQAGWELANINASGKNAKTEGKIFFNLVKERKVAGVEKIREVEIFFDSQKQPLRLGLWFKKGGKNDHE